MRPNVVQGAAQPKKGRQAASPSPPCFRESGKYKKSNEKNKVEIQHQKNNKNERQVQQPASMQQYFNFNKEKNVASRKVKCQKNYDYGENSKEANRTSGLKINSNQPDSTAKLKFMKPKTVIGFDGKMITIQPSTGRYTSQNRSLEHWTQAHKSQTKTLTKKLKQKSQPKIKISKKQSKSAPKLKQNSSQHHIKPFPQQVNSIIISQFLLTTKDNPSPPQTEQSLFSYFCRTSHLELEQIKILIQESHQKVKNFNINYLKRISQNLRSQWIQMLSKICADLKLVKDVFFLAVQLVDRYLNQQLILSRHKVLALASLSLCAKLDDRQMAKLISQGISHRREKSKSKLEQPNHQSMAQKYTKKIIQKQKKQQIQINMANMLSQLHKNIDQQLNQIPSPQQILQFQTLILLRQNFKIPRNNITFWLDLLCLSWDNHILNPPQPSFSLPTEFLSKVLFLQQKNPFNFLQISNLLQNCIHSLQFYQFPNHHLVLSSIFLLCRINCENKDYAYNEYRINLQKSNNILFVDKVGVNAVFGKFLEKFQMQIGDILGCCRFVSGFLEKFDPPPEKIREILQTSGKQIFYKHFYNIN